MIIYVAHWSGMEGWDFIGAFASKESADAAIEVEKKYDVQSDEFEYGVTAMEIM